MDIEKAREFLTSLSPDDRQVFYTAGDGTEVFAIRTDELTINDFSIGLKKPDEQEFNPTFIRLLIDLHLKKISNPDESDPLCEVFESIYEGEDCTPLIESARNKTFPMQLDGLDINMVCAQLLMIKREFNYGPGKHDTSYNPARGYLMAFIRWVLSEKNEIDKIVTAAVKEYMPPKQFDKNH